MDSKMTKYYNLKLNNLLNTPFVLIENVFWKSLIEFPMFGSLWK